VLSQAKYWLGTNCEGEVVAVAMRAFGSGVVELLREVAEMVGVEPGRVAATITDYGVVHGSPSLVESTKCAMKMWKTGG
jgi:hypothetical protein